MHVYMIYRQENSAALRLSGVWRGTRWVCLNLFIILFTHLTLILPHLHNNCFHMWHWKKCCQKHFSPLTPPPIINLFKVRIWAVIIGMIIFTILWLQDECLDEVVWYDIKWVKILLGFMSAKYKNLVFPLCYSQLGQIQIHQIPILIQPYL